MQPILKLAGIRKACGGVQALSDVSFELLPGEVHALVGENGAGKSTLVKIIAGAHQPDAGAIELAGEAVAELDPQRARALGIAAIYQQPALFPDLSVAENIAFGLEPTRFWRRVHWRARRERAARVLEEVGARIDPDVEAGRLTMPQQQLVEIAKAVSVDARVLILDEPTSSLSDSETEHLFSVIRRLKSNGVGMIYITHRLDELRQIADRVTVFRDGRLVGMARVADTSRSELIRMMVGRDLSAVFPKMEVPAGGPLLEVHGLSCQAEGVHEINLTVRSGEIVGLAGLVGAGRTELARVLFGLSPADCGEIRFLGQAVAIDSPQKARALGIGYVPEDRHRHGVILDLSVAANASLARLPTLLRWGLLDFDAEHRLASDFVSRLGVKTPSIDALVGQLSGGNQQKVALARWLATNPSLLILDEPTQGIDVGSKAEIHRLMCELAARGLGILMISSDLPEVLAATVALAAAWGLANLAGGRAIYATGSDAEAARLVGIRPQRVFIGVFVASGALAAVAALLNAVRFADIDPNAGNGLELQAIAVVVVGGAAVKGSRGTILGTVLGVLLLATIGPALVFLQVQPQWERAIQGAVILAAVSFVGKPVHGPTNAVKSQVQSEK